MDTIGKRSSSRTKNKVEGNPFRLIQEIRERIRTSTESLEAGGSNRVKYLWLHVTAAGIECGSNGHLSTEDWLNVVDEAGALGVQWVVIGWEATPGDGPDVWEICRWAQDVHDCHVGIHLLRGEPSEKDIEAMLQLKKDRTHVLADSAGMDRVGFLKDHGIDVCEADVNVTHRTGICTLPDDMVCVGSHGKLYTCGLVLGNERYCLGSVFERAFAHVVSDKNLPHHVPESAAREAHHSCNACPPLMVQRTLQGK